VKRGNSSHRPEKIVFENAILWAGKPLIKCNGGMCVCEGKITEVFHKGQESIGDGIVVDLAGMHVIPGLIDAHRHFLVSAMLGTQRDASGWTSKGDALGQIEAACRVSRGGHEWVFFSKMDHTKWRKPVLPTIREIDAVACGAAVFVSDITLHRGLVSSAAIHRAGLSRDRLRCADDIDAFKSGDLKGTIWEEAHGRVLFALYRDILSSYGEEERRTIIHEEAERCLKMGLTHVHDPGLPWDMQIHLKEVQERTPLKLSWSVTSHECLYLHPEQKDEEQALQSDHAPRSAKFFLDGAHRTAASMPVMAGVKALVRAGIESASGLSLAPLRLLFEQKIVLQGGSLAMPYLRYRDINDLVSHASFFTERGYRLVIHALGNSAACQASELVRTLNPEGGSSIEHVLVMGEEDLDLFAAAPSVASIQPGFIPIYAETLLRQGAVPYLKVFPLGSLKKRGVPVCISSDGPCGPDDPLYNIRRAVDRKTSDGVVLDAGEGISESDALAAGSLGGSESLGIRNDGLTPGADATFCVVDGDPFGAGSRVVQTWIDGVRVV